MKKIKQYLNKFWYIFIGVVGSVVYALYYIFKERPARRPQNDTNSTVFATMNDTINENEKLSEKERKLKEEILKKENKEKEKINKKRGQDIIDFFKNRYK